MNNNRLDYFDYAKALAIFMTVLIHIGFSEANNYVLFAMPLFFTVVGYTFTPGKRTLKENITGKFKTVLLPFWGFMLLYILVELIRAPYIGYGDTRLAIPAMINGVYGSGYIPNNSGIFNGILDFMYYVDKSSFSVDLITPTNPHLWFLPALFTSSVLFYCIMEKPPKTRLNKVLLILVLLFLSSLEVIIPQVKQLPYGLGRGFLGAAFMLVGFWMKKYGFFQKGKALAVPAMVVSCLLAVSAMLLGSNGSMFVISSYGPYGAFSVFMSFIGGVGAVCFVLYSCKLIEMLPLPRIKRLLSLVGRNTMAIYGWHMALKVLFDVAYLKIFNVPAYPDEFYMALLPPNAWWYMIFEAVAIVFTCILMSQLKAKLKNRFNRKLRVE